MTTLQASAQNQLRQLIEALERLEEERVALMGDVRDKFAEAKSMGFDVKAIRSVLKLRKKSKADREEEEAILQTYLHALGMEDGSRDLFDPSTTGLGHQSSVQGANA